MVKLEKVSPSLKDTHIKDSIILPRFYKVTSVRQLSLTSRRREMLKKFGQQPLMRANDLGNTECPSAGLR